MTIRASACLPVLLKLLFDSCHLWIRRFLIILVARGANGNGYVGSESAHRAGPRDVDVACRAFQHMLAFAALMTELCRDAFWPIYRHESSRKFVTAGAIITRWLLALPMTFETSVVSGGLSFESSRRRGKGIHQSCRRRGSRSHVRLMTD